MPWQSVRKHTSGKHGVEQQHPAVGNVLGQLVVEQLGLARLLVSLDQDLTDPDRPAAVPEALLHGLSGTHNGHTANLALKLDAGIVASNRGGDLMPHNGEMVQTFLDEQANDTVRVEDKVGTIRVLVTDHAVEALVADIADMSKDPYVSSAINCGVWGRMWMLA
jgi:hypothetical protein